MMTLPILVIGEALIDIVHPVSGQVQEFAGGSPANVAITLARLGQEAHLFSWFGTDQHGKIIADHLAESGVKLVDGSQNAARTSTALARLDETGAAQYVFDIEWALPDSRIEQRFAAAHLGSIAAVLEPGGSAAVEELAAQQPNAIITYDPNMRPDLMGSPDQVRPRVEEIVGLSDVVKVSDEDLEWLFPGQDPLEVARRWQTRGPALVVITRGGSGATAVSASQQVDVMAPTVTVADTVGAGDSFMGALIDHLASAGLLRAERREQLREMSAAQITELLEYAAQVAAITVSRPGANPPWRTELTPASTGEIPT